MELQTKLNALREDVSLIERYETGMGSERKVRRQGWAICIESRGKGMQRIKAKAATLKR